jgi:hypothetical protein
MFAQCDMVFFTEIVRAAAFMFESRVSEHVIRISVSIGL